MYGGLEDLLAPLQKADFEYIHCRFLHAVERASATHAQIVELLAAPLLGILRRVPGQLACLLLEASLANCHNPLRRYWQIV